jgi:membrane-associated phospholipid phosphatase
MEICSVYFANLFQTLQKNRFYFISFGIIWLIALYFQLTVPQYTLSQVINASYSPAGDFTMKYLTYAGDGLFLAIIGLAIVLLDRKLWMVTLLCLAVPSIITQLLKHFVFEDFHRPAVMMIDVPGLHYIEGVFMNQYNSFPSGHTTAAFSLYTLLALVTGNKKLGFMWVIIAVFVALSRVYLLQHFWQDIVAGAMIGTLMCTVIFIFFVPKLTSNATKE